MYALLMPAARLTEPDATAVRSTQVIFIFVVVPDVAAATAAALSSIVGRWVSATQT